MNMEKNWKKLFAGLASQAPSRGFTDLIFSRILEKERRSARLRFGFYLSIAGLSCLALVPALRYASQELSQSSFFDYLSLAFSDGGTVLAYWREFVLSLAESAPVFGIAMVLLVLFIASSSFMLAFKSRTAQLLA